MSRFIRPFVRPSSSSWMRWSCLGIAIVVAACGDDESAARPPTDASAHTGADAGPAVRDGGGTRCADDPECDPPGVDAPIRQLQSGRHHTCALLRDGSTYCWGQGAYRALGGDYNFQGVPRRVDAIDDAVTIASGTRFGCALRASGGVWCWGENDHAQIGANATIPCGDCTPLPECADSICVPAPQPMPGLESGVVELALGGAHGCARFEDGRVACWGDNSSGQAGQPDTSGDITGPETVGGVSGARQISAGVAHTCALIGSPGEVMCWGQNDRAQVGNGETNDAVPVPSSVAGLTDAVEIVAGGSHTCARRASGAVVCWGYNYLGALGNGSTRPTRASSIEQVVGLEDATGLAAGQYFTCALRSTGTLVCWGHNQHGQLGDGTAEGADCDGRDCRTTPVEVMVVSDAVLVNAGELHACAASSTGNLWCWGYNLGGQLGTGGVDSGPTPVPIEVAGLPVAP
jgi:alpha-tubulin suppressor-like RCC1 family protein